jgi:hypothetical protein
MRPIEADAVANLATEQFIAGHAEHLALDIEQRIFDRGERLGDDAAGAGTGRRKQLGMDSLVLQRVLPDHARRKPLDRRAEPGGAEAFVKLAPADHAIFGGDLDEMVVSPAGVASKRFHATNLR